MKQNSREIELELHTLQKELEAYRFPAESIDTDESNLEALLIHLENYKFPLEVPEIVPDELKVVERPVEKEIVIQQPVGLFQITTNTAKKSGDDNALSDNKESQYQLYSDSSTVTKLQPLKNKMKTFLSGNTTDRTKKYKLVSMKSLPVLPGIFMKHKVTPINYVEV
jgi:hypothetical protein